MITAAVVVSLLLPVAGAPPPASPAAPVAKQGEPPATAAPATAAPATAAPATAAPATAAPAGAPGERARAAVARLKSTLIAELAQGMAAGGPAHAVSVCGDVAARVRRELQAPDLRIGRTSSRLRNPQNTAPAWVVPVLEELERAPADKRVPRELALPGGGFGYVEPLVAAPLCLQCHGVSVAPAVTAAVAAKYPADKATGFREGDLRGVVWVEVLTHRSQGASVATP